MALSVLWQGPARRTVHCRGAGYTACRRGNETTGGRNSTGYSKRLLIDLWIPSYCKPSQTVQVIRRKIRFTVELQILFKYSNMQIKLSTCDQRWNTKALQNSFFSKEPAPESPSKTPKKGSTWFCLRNFNDFKLINSNAQILYLFPNQCIQ